MAKSIFTTKNMLKSRLSKIIIDLINQSFISPTAAIITNNDSKPVLDAVRSKTENDKNATNIINVFNFRLFSINKYWDMQ